MASHESFPFFQRHFRTAGKGDDIHIRRRPSARFFHVFDETAVEPLKSLDETRRPERGAELQQAGQYLNALLGGGVTPDNVGYRDLIGRHLDAPCWVLAQERWQNA